MNPLCTSLFAVHCTVYCQSIPPSRELFAAFDTDGDGGLTEEEFIRLEGLTD